LLIAACGRFNFDPIGGDDVAGGDAVPFAGGDGHVCAIRDGALYCWGKNSNGQLGRGMQSSFERTPARVGTELGWTSICASGNHTCGVRDGALFCWGLRVQGRLGDGMTSGLTSTPIQIGTAAWTSVRCQEDQSCGLQTDGSLWCWGGNDLGELGVPPPTTSPTPAQINGSWTHVAVGFNYVTALATDQSYWAWGANEEGQLGNGLRGGSNVPVATIALPFRAITVDAGREHSCAATGGGELWCWGDSRAGQIGVGTISTNDEPTPRSVGLPPITSFTAGGLNTCAVTDGALWCWGDNTSGQLAQGDLGAGTERGAPARVGTATNWQNASAGVGVICGTRGGEVYCWGDNTLGQLGTGMADTSAALPVGPLVFP
jgi:alpha-tubulin suppressor-like RCC1 family protein